MRSPKVSVVIDNFNYAAYVQDAIRSALAQSYRRVEVVVVDDGSTDSSRQVIRRYAYQVKVVEKPNGGQASALNVGLAASTGEVVLFLDSDDTLYPDAVEEIVRQVRPGIAKVHFRLDMVDAEGRSIGHTNPPAHRRLACGDVAPLLLSTGRYVTPVMSGNAYTRSALLAVAPIPEPEFRYSADGYLVCTTPFHGGVAAVERSLGTYRVHGRNAWVSDLVDAESARRRIAHDRARNAALRRQAEAAGRRPHRRLERRDRAHVAARLASLRLEPDRHPVPGDTVTALMRDGIVATCLERGYAGGRRIRMCLWFVAVGTLPRMYARRLVTSLYAPQRRGRGTYSTAHAG